MTKDETMAIAAVLDANHSPYPIVFDMADVLEDQNPGFARGDFILFATINLRKDNLHNLRMIEREVTR